MTVRAILTIARLTLKEAARRRVVLAAVICGLAFLALFATGFFFIERDMSKPGQAVPPQRMFLHFVTLAGLYAAQFLGVMAAVLVPVDALATEIGSGVMQTLASKPVRRSEILLGKWLACVALVAAYLAFLAGGVLILSRALGGAPTPRLELGLPLMLLSLMVLVTLSIAGGTRLGAIANGITTLGFYGLAFIGHWVEQIGTLTGNESARYVGTVASLIMPSEAMYQLAAHHMQPPIMRDLQLTPFSPASVPSPAMVAWAGLHITVVLTIALLAFRRRPL